MLSDVLLVVHDVLLVVHDVSQCFMMFYCFMMFSESCNDQCRRIGNHLKDRDNDAGIGDNSAEISDDAIGIVYIAAKVTPS